MKAQREQWNYENGEVAIRRYRNSHNTLHWHYDCELLYVERGELSVFCDQKQYVLTAGQAFFINSEKVHYMHAVTPDTTLAAFVFDFGIIKSFAGDVDLVTPVLAHDYDLPALYEKLKSIIAAKSMFFNAEIANCISLKMIEIFRGETVAPKEKLPRAVERLKQLLSDIDERYCYYDLQTAAEFMCMNPAYLSRLFHRQVGMPFSQYLNRVKCEKAVAILQGGADVAITELASRCGFETVRQFNRIFKSLTGYTPKSLPKDFVFEWSFIDLDELSHDPTLKESVLLDE